MSLELEQKFRVALTIKELKYLIGLCENDQRIVMDKISNSLVARMKVFIYKAEVGTVAPSFSSAPRMTLEERLGLETMSPTEMREHAWRKYQAVQGDTTQLTSHELALAQTYRFENGHMTATEETAFLNGDSNG